MVGEPLRVNWDEKSAYEYYAIKRSYTQRKKIIEKVLKQGINRDSGIICSVGCGFAGEESAFFGYLQHKFVLIDADKTVLDLAKKFHWQEYGDTKNVFYYDLDFNSLNIKEFEKNIDLIYTASPSDWMYQDWRIGVPDNYIDFINKYLTNEGYFISIIYGAQYNQDIIRNIECLKSLRDSIEKHNFQMVDRFYIENFNSSGIIDGRQLVIVVCRKEKKSRIIDLKW